ncbi:MAG: ester cyclase [Pseudomonadota bacterium]
MRDITEEKQRVATLLDALADGAAPAAIFAPDAVAQISHPWGVRQGADAVAEAYLAIKTALPDHERRPDILIGGENHPDDRTSEPRFSPLVGWLGTLQGTFAAPLCGIPPTSGAVHLRICEVHHLNEAGKIARSWVLIDLLDLMDQADVWPLPPMPGARGPWPGPRGGGGVRLDSTDAEGGAQSMARVLDMHHGLNTNPTLKLDTLSMDHWAPNFMYYAGAGIGMCRGTDGFRRHHQLPFRTSFPDRHSRGHFVRIGDGRFALTGGRLYATHQADYLGLPATGKPVHIDVMDFYRFDDAGLIAENWLPFDILGLAAQAGVDLLARIPRG